MAAAIASLAIGCSQDLTPEVTSAIQQVVAAAPDGKAGTVQADVRQFYEQRANAPVWVTKDSTAEPEDALKVIRTAPNHGLVEADYIEQELAQLIDAEDDVEKQLKDDPQALARFDVQLTTALLALGRDVAMGRIEAAGGQQSVEGEADGAGLRRHAGGSGWRRRQSGRLAGQGAAGAS